MRELPWVLLLAACGGGGSTAPTVPDDPVDVGTTADTDAEADADADSDTDVDADTDADTDSDADADTGGVPPGCGDLTCGGGETCADCPVDCGPCSPTCASNGACDPGDGETCESCPSDCDTRSAVCGNGECQGGETSASCMADCGPSPWPSAWAGFEAAVVTEMNAMRAAGTDCPSGAKAAVGPLTMDAALLEAARLHSWDQSFADYFSHTSCNGRQFWDRVGAAGGSASAENIAWNYPTPASAVAGWMSSTSGHCDAIMEGGFGRVGIGYSDVTGAPIWTAVFD